MSREPGRRAGLGGSRLGARLGAGPGAKRCLVRRGKRRGCVQSPSRRRAARRSDERREAQEVRAHLLVARHLARRVDAAPAAQRGGARGRPKAPSTAQRSSRRTWGTRPALPRRRRPVPRFRTTCAFLKASPSPSSPPPRGPRLAPPQRITRASHSRDSRLPRLFATYAALSARPLPSASSSSRRPPPVRRLSSPDRAPLGVFSRRALGDGLNTVLAAPRRSLRRAQQRLQQQAPEQPPARRSAEKSDANSPAPPPRAAPPRHAPEKRARDEPRRVRDPEASALAPGSPPKPRRLPASPNPTRASIPRAQL